MSENNSHKRGRWGDLLSQAMLGCSGSDVVIGSGRIFGYKVVCDFGNSVFTIGSDGWRIKEGADHKCSHESYLGIQI